MPRIYVNTAPLQHRASGFLAWAPGEFDFSDAPEYAGWLRGQAERGNVSLVGEAPAPDPETLTKRRCKAIKTNGEQCKSDALAGSDYCMSKAHQKQGAG